MDKPFDISKWQPTKPHDGHQDEVRDDLPRLADQLADQTRTILHYPYDPNNWLRRARTLRRLRYPELAVGDAQKAALLCRGHLARLDNDKRWVLGYGMGFALLDDSDMSEDENADEADETEEPDEVSNLRERLVNMHAAAHRLQKAQLQFADAEEGRYVPRPYPWTEERHQGRSDSLIAELNMDFAKAVPVPKESFVIQRAREGATCVVKRHAFGKTSSNSADVLGVFTTHSMPKDQKLLTDRTVTWGCTGPGLNGSRANLHGGFGCMDELHPNAPEDDADLDLRWVRERAGRDAAEIIVRARFLMLCIQDRVQHPLDHPLIARLTPTYRKDKICLFSLEQDIAILNDLLQNIGIDIFANLAYDTWTLFVLRARVANNSWSDPIHTGISPLFSLFNHSCDPNVEWSIDKDDYSTIYMQTSRLVAEGEQLFVEYDSYLHDKPVGERRKRLRHWFDADCMCARCVREEEEAAETAMVNVCLDGYEWGEYRLCNTSNGVPEWDVQDKPVFPEDEINAVRSAALEA